MWMWLGARSGARLCNGYPLSVRFLVCQVLLKWYLAQWSHWPLRFTFEENLFIIRCYRIPVKIALKTSASFQPTRILSWSCLYCRASASIRGVPVWSHRAGYQRISQATAPIRKCQYAQTNRSLSCTAAVHIMEYYALLPKARHVDELGIHYTMNVEYWVIRSYVKVHHLLLRRKAKCEFTIAFHVIIVIANFRKRLICTASDSGRELRYTDAV